MPLMKVLFLYHWYAGPPPVAVKTTEPLHKLSDGGVSIILAGQTVLQVEPVIVTPSMYAPTPETEMSVPLRHLKTIR